MTPTCSPFSSIRRTCGTRMRSLILVWSRSGGRRSNLRGTGTQLSCAKNWVNENSLPARPGSMRALHRLLAHALGELGDRHRPRVTVAMLAHGDGRALGLPVAHDE